MDLRDTRRQAVRCTVPACLWQDACKDDWEADGLLRTHLRRQECPLVRYGQGLTPLREVEADRDRIQRMVAELDAAANRT